jgi:hypothetical protein
MSESKHIIIGGQPLPIDINAVLDSEAQHRDIGLAPAQFDFSYDSIHFACRCERRGEADGGGALFKLVGDVGPHPFTAESTAARNAVQAIIDRTNIHLGPIFRLSQGRVLVGTEQRLSVPVTATDLVSTIVTFLLPLRPYFALMAEVIRPPLQSSRPGESAVRPGWRRNPLRITGR